MVVELGIMESFETAFRYRDRFQGRAQELYDHFECVKSISDRPQRILARDFVTRSVSFWKLNIPPTTVLL